MSEQQHLKGVAISVKGRLLPFAGRRRARIVRCIPAAAAATAASSPESSSVGAPTAGCSDVDVFIVMAIGSFKRETFNTS